MASASRPSLVDGGPSERLCQRAEWARADSPADKVFAANPAESSTVRQSELAFQYHVTSRPAFGVLSHLTICFVHHETAGARVPSKDLQIRLLRWRNEASDRVLKPRRTVLFTGRYGRPLLSEDVRVDLVSIGDQQRLDVHLVLRAEGNHLC